MAAAASSHQVADAVEGVEGHGEGEAELGQPDEGGAYGQRVDRSHGALEEFSETYVCRFHRRKV